MEKEGVAHSTEKEILTRSFLSYNLYMPELLSGRRGFQTSKVSVMRMSSRTGVLIAIVAAVLAGCASAQYLKTSEVSSSGLSGTYTLILHGARYAGDVQNVAILDKEGDPYIFAIYAPAFYYKTRRGVPAAQAVKDAEKFVRVHFAVQNSQWKKILGPDGSEIGYEVRPLYEPLETGYPDILEITYTITEKEVVARISFRPEIERGILREEEDRSIFKRVR